MAGSREEQLFIGSSKVKTPLSDGSSWSWNALGQVCPAGCPGARAQRGCGAESLALCDSHGRRLASGVAQGWGVAAQPLPAAAEPGSG